MARKKLEQKVTTAKLERATYSIFELTRGDGLFIVLIFTLSLICALVTPYPEVAMWVGFGLAGYSAIANDSIQTIGTFIASNATRKWWVLWLYIGGIFLAAVLQSWLINNGDVSSGRLASKGFENAPTSFSFLQLAAPLILLILTRMKMPVSTTFLILNSFTSSSKAIGSVVTKSLMGYGVAFIVAIVVWFLVSKTVSKLVKGKPSSYWLPIQWITSGLLWFSWIQQDAANIAVYLPRQLSTEQFLGFAGFIFLGLGLLFYLRGDRIQHIVTEKSGVTDIRAATLVDFVYAILLFYFKGLSNIPMSTTWVFIGLLAGREIAISFSKKRASKRKMSLMKSFRMMRKDLLKALFGLVISMILAIAINENVRTELWQIIAGK
ncbi:hypothetical protein V6R21_20565 [Limibacter armeniacum]|uniref:hypothetical protein n=1 Tax=Limibacter armeniacum TaxID=466084 RepID=UPI002FE68732